VFFLWWILKIHNTAAKPAHKRTSFVIYIKSIILQLYDAHVYVLSIYKLRKEDLKTNEIRKKGEGDGNWHEYSLSMQYWLIFIIKN